MQTTHKIELKPNSNQLVYFKKACGASRFAYNWGLAKWREIYLSNKNVEPQKRIYPNGLSLKKEFNSIKDDQFPFVKEVTKWACQQPFIYLDKAFKSYFKDGKGFPNFQKKGVATDSFYIGGDSVRILDKTLKIPHLEPIKMKEVLRFDGKINSVTISRTADRWFASVQVEILETLPVSKKDNREVVGIGLGGSPHIVTSEGEGFFIDESVSSIIKRLSREKRVLAKRLKLAKEENKDLWKSRNYQKQVLRVEKLQYKLDCKRNDKLHKITSHITSKYSAISIEDKSVIGKIKSHNQSNRLILFCSGEFRRQLEYKAQKNGSCILIVDNFSAREKCHLCEKPIHEKEFLKNTFSCECGVKCLRSFNSAFNLKKKIGGASAEFTPVEILDSRDNQLVSLNQCR